MLSAARRSVSVHLMQLADAAAQPWRNGGGITRELLAWRAPDGLAHDELARRNREASAGDWDLRVSVADITQDGPFSAFPGVSRCFAVLEGAGVVLTLRGKDQILTPASEPLAFDGVEAPGCRLVSGPTRDLNLMVRHSAGQAWMQQAVAGQRRQMDEPWAWQGLYTQGAALLDTPDGRVALPAGSLVWSDASMAKTPEPAPLAPWCLVDGAQAWWLGLLVRRTGQAQRSGSTQSKHLR